MVSPDEDFSSGFLEVLDELGALIKDDTAF